MNPASGSLVIDRYTWEAWYDRQHLPLTPAEALVLSLLIERPGNLVASDVFARALWPEQLLPPDQAERRLYVLVSRLRAKLPCTWEYEMERIRKRGYVLRPRVRCDGSQRQPRAATR